MLREFGCDAVQGYYFSKAVPAARFEQLLAAGSIAGETARRRRRPLVES
jgi:EAL domain-containing protein (putative c-di-GMP-specific phosphodiesterase class I)